MIREDVRNVAIIAHVDHGKTTLVDGLLKTSGLFRENEAVKDRVMDSDSIEKERGITILAKNTAVSYKDMKINIIDTPGHADFGGEVERVLNMAESVVLVVDSHEGPMPQTKFVLKKAIELGLPAIICINKVDRPDQRIEEVEDEILDLFISLDADESYLESPIVYASAKQGWASLDRSVVKEDMTDLLDTIIEYTPAFEADESLGEHQVLAESDHDFIFRLVYYCHLGALELVVLPREAVHELVFPLIDLLGSEVGAVVVEGEDNLAFAVGCHCTLQIFRVVGLVLFSALVFLVLPIALGLDLLLWHFPRVALGHQEGWRKEKDS